MFTTSPEANARQIREQRLADEQLRVYEDCAGQLIGEIAALVLRDLEKSDVAHGTEVSTNRSSHS